jgi:hypothetical protein
MKKPKTVIKILSQKNEIKTEGLTLVNINKRIWQGKLEIVCNEVNGKVGSKKKEKSS